MRRAACNPPQFFGYVAHCGADQGAGVQAVSNESHEQPSGVLRARAPRGKFVRCVGGSVHHTLFSRASDTRRANCAREMNPARCPLSASTSTRTMGGGKQRVASATNSTARQAARVQTLRMNRLLAGGGTRAPPIRYTSPARGSSAGSLRKVARALACCRAPHARIAACRTDQPRIPLCKQCHVVYAVHTSCPAHAAPHAAHTERCVCAIPLLWRHPN